MGNALCVPLTVGSGPLGVVVLGCHRREPLPTGHLSLLHAAIKALAVTIHNSQVGLRNEVWARGLAFTESASRETRRPPLEADRILAGDNASTKRAGNPRFLDFRCLGRFTLIRNGLVVPLDRFARRRSLAILKILLARYGKQVHREELMALLWPEADTSTAGLTLNVAAHYLRGGLEPDIACRQPSSFIGRDGDYYYFNTHSPHHLDSQALLEATDLAARLEADGRVAEALEACRRAIALYRGDFLEDEPYSDWCDAERRHVRERFLSTLRRAARLYSRRGDAEAAIALYRRALSIDETLEEIHRALMHTLWRAGRREDWGELVRRIPELEVGS